MKKRLLCALGAAAMMASAIPTAFAADIPRHILSGVGVNVMPAWIFIALTIIIGMCLRHLNPFQKIQHHFSNRLSASSFSHTQLLLCSRSSLIVLIADMTIYRIFTTIILPIWCLIILILIYAIIHCIIFMFANAAYDLVKKDK